jgi:cytoskeletal protein CcmA (bactofilin family)
MSQGSIIGPRTVVRGSVRGQGSLEISGRVEGDVQVTGDVAIGETGAVLGNVSGASISVQGAVQGDLHGTEAVLIERGGKVVGDLSAPRIGIASGALVRGNVRTETEPLPAARKPLPSPAARPAPFVAKPVAKVEPKLPAVVAAKAAPLVVAAKPVVAAPPAKSEPQAAPAPRKDAKEKDERRPPPPVLPSMGKGAKAKLKKSREE